MQDNLHKATNNLENLDVTQYINAPFINFFKELAMKSDAMHEVSHQFGKNAKQLERIMYWRNVKLNCIICFMVLAVILWFTFPYIWDWGKETFGDDDEDTTRLL